MGLGVGLSGCGGDDAVAPFQPTTDPARLFTRLVLDHPAVNLSTAPGYTTVQLVATPLDGVGAPMADLPAPRFRSSDTTRVHVTPEGLVTALQPTTGAMVIAELVGPGNVRHIDTALVNVHDATAGSPPELATFAIDPVAPDSAVLAISPDLHHVLVRTWLDLSIAPGEPLNWKLPHRTRALTAEGAAIPSLQVEYASLDPAVATIDRRTGQIRPRRAGTVRLVARTFAYGVSKEATAGFTVTPPYVQTVLAQEQGGPLSIFGPTIVIRPHGVVVWMTTLPQPIDVVFDDPAAAIQPPLLLCIMASGVGGPAATVACGTGNFTSARSTTPFVTGSARLRQFTTPGTYRYRDAQTGAVGRVVVTTDGF